MAPCCRRNPMRLSILFLAAACATPGAKKMDDNVPSCSTLAECKAHDGERVRVVGEYAVWDPLPSRARTDPPAQQVILKLADGKDGPFLGAWGHDDHTRPLDEIAQLRGKRVQVTGTFRSKMPPHPTDPPYATSLTGPCIHPIERVSLE